MFVAQTTKKCSPLYDAVTLCDRNDVDKVIHVSNARAAATRRRERHAVDLTETLLPLSILPALQLMAMRHRVCGSILFVII